jgi:hypothetical protein
VASVDNCVSVIIIVPDTGSTPAVNLRRIFAGPASISDLIVVSAKD